MDIITDVLGRNDLLFAFVVVGGNDAGLRLVVDYCDRGRPQGSAIAIGLGLVLAYIGGMQTGGEKGLADIAIFSGLGLMGGAMLRDYATVATAYGVDLPVIKKSGLAARLSLLLGIGVSLVAGALVAVVLGYTDPESLAAIGAGAATYIVGPVTGTAVGASTEVIALSVAAGLIKAVIVMGGTPLIAPLIGLNNPKAAKAYGG